MALPSAIAMPVWIAIGVAVAGWAGAAALKPRVTPSVATAFVPWAVAGAATHAVATVTAYPDPVAPLLAVPGIYATTAAAIALAWIVAILVGNLGDAESGASYLVASGYGAAILPVLVVLTVAVTGSGRVDAFLSAGGLLIAVIVGTVVLYLGIARVYPDAITETGLGGGLLLGGQLLDAVAAAYLLGGSGVPLYDRVAEIVATTDVPSPVAFVSLRVLIALLLLVALTAIGKRRTGPAIVAIGAVAAIGVGAGANILLVTIIG